MISTHPARLAGKHRGPVAIWLLSLVTFGIYGVVWYYKINRETRDLGVPANPGVSVVAVTIGALILVPPFVSVYKTGERIAQAQRAAGVAMTCSAVVGLLLWVFVFGTGMIYYQSELNKIWDNYGNPQPGSPLPAAPGQQAMGYQPPGSIPPGSQSGYPARDESAG